MNTDNEPVGPATLHGTREISGRWVVLGMFVFAALVTLTMYVYWRMHTAPYLPLQKQLFEAYPDSRPRVEGGQRDMSEETVKTLRITMAVEFHPTEDEEKLKTRADAVAEIAKKSDLLPDYEVLEVHLFRGEPEREIHQKVVRYRVSDLLKNDEL